MHIDWNHFTPWGSLAGGLLIGLTAVFLVLLNGRILGVSGFVGGLLRPRAGDVSWRVTFILGMVLAPVLYLWLVGPVRATVDADWVTLVLAGLLVGLGTRYAAGCTSGHGVCGLSRLSPRSLVATLTFMAAGFATVGLVRHVFA